MEFMKLYITFPIKSYYWAQTDNNIRTFDYNKRIF